ncbi:regulator [Streptomyces sp. NPDC001828]|uniref:regulator n=1 Tax=Streptomyces sp. NPDC001828 TaxID=3364615 RepID=UPI0036ACE588
MTTPFTPADIRQAVDLLASRPLIRLVTEIDDNGAIPPRRLASTLPDLSSHQLRWAAEAARAHGLVRTVPGAGLVLTTRGTELADVYDAAARWARQYAYPAPVCEFSLRIRRVLDLLTPSLATEQADGVGRSAAGHLTSADDAEGLARPRALLIQWLAVNRPATWVSEPERAA